jgi:hypothetical protein
LRFLKKNSGASHNPCGERAVRECDTRSVGRAGSFLTTSDAWTRCLRCDCLAGSSTVIASVVFCARAVAALCCARGDCDCVCGAADCVHAGDALRCPRRPSVIGVGGAAVHALRQVSQVHDAGGDAAAETRVQDVQRDVQSAAERHSEGLLRGADLRSAVLSPSSYRWFPLAVPRCSECASLHDCMHDCDCGDMLQFKCPLDDFELVLFSLGNAAKAQGKTYPLCPYCYNEPPFDGLTSMGCNSCLHPTCRHRWVGVLIPSLPHNPLLYFLLCPSVPRPLTTSSSFSPSMFIFIPYSVLLPF